MTGESAEGTGRGGGAAVWALGILTICVYGGWFYSFGVLLGPMEDDEGWSAAALGTVFGTAILVNGLASAPGGRLLDRAGPRRTFLLAAAVSGLGLGLAALQTSVVAFGVLFALGGGLAGALGFYHVTQAAAARAVPGRASWAIARLTIIGAVSSAIYLPLTAWLVDVAGWRWALGMHAATTAGSFALAALLVPDHRGQGLHATGSSRVAFAHAWRGHAFRLLLGATLLSGIAADIMLAFQVPVMEDAGLAVGAAAAVAGLRGFAQLLGRLPLMVLLRHVTPRAALALAYAGAAVAACLLVGSGTLPVAVAYSLIAGAATGAASPLVGIYTAQLVERSDLGLLLGVQQALYGIAGAAGPIAVGVLLDATGSWLPAIALTAVGFVGAAVLLAVRPRADAMH